MGEILGLTVSHFPYIRMKPWVMPNVLRGLLMRGWVDKVHLKYPENWPEEMRRDWGDDQGETAGKKAQAHQVEQFRKLRGALDDFDPDLTIVLYRDLGETWRAPERPKYWIHAHGDFKTKFYNIHGSRDNLFEEDPDREDTIHVNTEAAQKLLKHLEDKGHKPTARTEPSPNPLNIGHNFVAGMFHLDWDKQQFETPVVPIGIEPFGYNRTRVPEGLGPWDKSQTPPLTPEEGFELGRSIAQFSKASPWRVAIVASTNWSNSQNTLSDRGSLMPFREADQKRFEQWKGNQFDQWGSNWTHDEMEEYAEWECITSIILAGAMSEIGSKVKYADLHTNTCLNSDWPTTIFEVK